MRLVLDTNIFISGLIATKSTPGKIIKAWKNGKIDIILSEKGILEIARVLGYPKIFKYLKQSNFNIENFLSTLRFMCDIVDISGIEVNVPRDPNDNHILATFIAGKADFLISGDKDLLSLKEKYKILSPVEFEKMFL
jgi:putative PIN family toxin of toxin-antitoxin system